MENGEGETVSTEVVGVGGDEVCFILWINSLEYMLTCPTLC